MATHNLGLLKAFPGEIRAEIWRNLRPSAASSASRNASQGRDALGVLRAGRQLSEEIIPYLYDEEILDIYVESVWSEWITIENALGARWSITSILDELYDRFSNLPYQKLKQLRISINAIETGKENRIYSLSKNVRNLVHLLEHTSGLPSLEIHFLNSSAGKWAKPNGRPVKTLLRDEGYGTIEKDYDVVLLPLCRLRKVPQVRIYIPDDLTSEGYTFENAELAMERTSPFGSVVGDHDYWDDNCIQEILDDIFILLENDLDMSFAMSFGEDADMMRLERFMFWYGEDGSPDYVREWGRICQEPYAEDPSYTESFINLRLRHDWLLTLNPLSAPMQEMRLQLGLLSKHRRSDFPLKKSWSNPDCRSYFKKVNELQGHKESLNHDEQREADQDKAAMDRLRTCWSQTAWKEYYPLGIMNRLFSRYYAFPEGLNESVQRYRDAGCDLEKHGVELINERSKIINFKAGERTRKALGRFVDDNQQGFSDSERHKDLGSKVCKVWDEFQL
ncbi:hypothetical protein DL98DRAFT_591006 [Cadophora sp. DSE1049]|nr:hypothetical protein DL98DRAFT_591006 [Cadophora sp. DSE1049]